MKNIPATLTVILMVLLIGCQNSPAAEPAPDPVQESQTATTLPAATITVPTQTPLPDINETTSAVPEVETPASGSTDAALDNVPVPSLFPSRWDDREIYKVGLVPDEVSVLQEMPGATIYHLSLDITDPTKVAGQMEARYTNQEDLSLDELMLHLFAPSLGGDIDVSDIRINGKPAAAQMNSRMLQIELEEPLDPGGQAVVSLDFTTTVPGEESTKYKVLAYDQNILALAHFYPMFAVYDDSGWHTEPTADHGDETFADMSYYLVQVDAPSDHLLAAAGTEVKREELNGNQRITFAAGPVRDFYLAASEDFEVIQRQLGPVLLSSYAPSGLMDGAQLALDVAARSLESFSQRYGSYPYTELDIVSTPTDALGIEYPGIFANAIRIYDLSENSSSGLPNAVLLESTTAHETGHQWFYNLIGNDQLNEPWLDEATTQYATWQYFIDAYGKQNAQGFYDSLEQRWGRADFAEIPIGLPADAYSGLEYGAVVYGRGPIFLNNLAEEMGQETFDAFLRDYSEQYRWQIAYGEDFMRLAEQHCNCDLSDLFEEQVFGN